MTYKAAEMNVRTRITEIILQFLATQEYECSGRKRINRVVRGWVISRGGHWKEHSPVVADVLLALCRDQIIEPQTRDMGYWLLDRPDRPEGVLANSAKRVVSMIYLRPTNDIPVNRIAASVIGPVWGSSGLL